MPTCPVGQVWNDALGMCVAIPNLPNTPPNPPVLVSQDCTAGVTLSSGVWDTDPDHLPTAIYLYRNDVVAPLHVCTDAVSTYLDATALTPGTYHYTTRGYNDWGLSASPSSTLDVPTARSSGQLHVDLTAITNGTPASGIITLLAQVSGTDTLDGGAPLDILVNGVSQAGSLARSDADPNQFELSYDSAAARAVGAIVFEAIALNDSGCKSAVASLTISIDNTLARTTAYEMWDRLAAAAIVRAGLLAHLVPARNDPSDRLWEFRVLSPIPDPLPDPDDLAAMAEWFRRAQQWKLFTRETVNGTANDPVPPSTEVTYTPPDTGMLLIGKRQAPEALTTYDTGSNQVVKIRYVSDDIKIVIVADAFGVLRFTSTGLSAIPDGSGILASLAAATDGAWVSDSEVHAVLGGKIYIADLDAGQLSLAATPVVAGALETLPALFTEAAGGIPYWVFGDGSGARLYKYVAGAGTLAHTFTAPVTLTYARGATLLLVCDTALYQWDGGALTLLYTHTASITGLQLVVESATYVQFADDSGRVYNLAGAVATLLNGSGTSFPVRALGRFQGAFPTVHGALGGDDNQLFLQDGGSAYVAVTAFETGATISALERLSITLVEGIGDPLMGGTPAVIDESLLIGVNQAASAGAYIARYQVVQQTAFMYRAQGVRDILFEEIA